MWSSALQRFARRSLKVQKSGRITNIFVPSLKSRSSHIVKTGCSFSLGELCHVRRGSCIAVGHQGHVDPFLSLSSLRLRTSVRIIPSSHQAFFLLNCTVSTLLITSARQLAHHQPVSNLHPSISPLSVTSLTKMSLEGVLVIMFLGLGLMQTRQVRCSGYYISLR